MRGCITAPYAYTTVLCNSFSYTNLQDGISWSDLILTDYAVSPGDSGGAAFMGTIDLGRTTCVIGVISAGGDTVSVVVKASNINNY